MGESVQTLVFRLEEQLFALPVELVERVVLAVRITVLPEAPPLILGLVNAWEQLLPVFDLRRRLLLPARPLRPSDRMIITGGELPLCFAVDALVGVMAFAAPQLRAPGEVHPELAKFLSGVATVAGETVLVFARQSLFGGLDLAETRSFLAGQEEAPDARLGT